MSLETRDLAIGYDNDLISDISITVTPGKIVTLIGPNGSGKSTILRTVCGLLKKRGGVIFLDRTDTAALSGKEVAKKISVVMTNRIDPELMTCREVIENARYPYTGMFGNLTEEDKKKVDEAIDATQTRDIADVPFTNISDGQRQRVMLARSICQDPDILVLDEPTSFLDIRYRIDILSKIKDLAKRRNIGILMSVHEPETAMKLSDHVIAVGDGRIMREGPVEEVFGEDFIRKLYGLGDMDVDLLGTQPWLTASVKDHEKAADIACPTASGVIMVMGTMSSVGKSVITAGLCRIFAQDGYSVAPFKSQNMANNSYVTADGLEMGRAQVMQAMACKIEPDVTMNPVLLKPVSDCGSQVIVNGRPEGNMSASRYFEYKSSLIPVIKDAFDKLRSRYDIVVIEGAGSPAEINLKENDIVNTGLAKMVNAPVILVGDIDRGGVFAQLLGTLDLLEEDERRRIKGLVINKFRGDEKLLAPGIRMLGERCSCPVIGTIPYMKLSLDDEDSLSERLMQKERKGFDIAVIALPHMANFTDFGIFDTLTDVSVRFVSGPEELDGADMVIIPGTKNTIGDMRWLRDALFPEKIRLLSRHTAIIGICGGYQMLGRTISDPLGTECKGSEEGIGLLDVDTILSEDKTRKLFEGRICDPTGILSGIKDTHVKGYEIHTGKTVPSGKLCEFTSGGTGYCNGNVYGTYVHGLFDTKECAAAVIRAVAAEKDKSVDTSPLTDKEALLDEQFDILADTLRKYLDMKMIYDIVFPEKRR